MAKIYQCRPSELLRIEDSYTAFCFDEACSYIMAKLMTGETPTYLQELREGKNHFRTFSEMNKELGLE